MAALHGAPSVRRHRQLNLDPVVEASAGHRPNGRLLAMRRGRIVWVVFCVVFSSAVGYAVTTLVSSPAAPPYQLTVAVIPKLNLPQSEVSGVSPVVTTTSFDDTAVNHSLRAIVIDAENSYSSQVRAELRLIGGKPPSNVPAVYGVEIDPNLISISRSLVSGLLPTGTVTFGGAPGPGWMSFSIAIPSGHNVDLLGTLFRDPTAALAYIALTASTYFCGKSYLGTCPVQSPLEAEASLGLTPTRANFRFMALVPSGLAIGFPIHQMPGTNSIGIVVPYRNLHPFLSSNGKLMTSTAVEPRFINLSKRFVGTQWMALWGIH
jgi:hypothetical protein